MEALGLFNDFVEFSLALNRLDGPTFLGAGDFRQNVATDLLKFVRDDQDLGSVVGDKVLGEVRFAPDGTLDILRWSRPQNDGPALRALTLLRFWRLEAFHPRLRLASMRQLLESDLAFTCARAGASLVTISGRRVLGRHYHTRLVQHAALREGAEWSEAIGEARRAQVWRETAREIIQNLDEHIDAEGGVYRTPAAWSISPLDFEETCTLVASMVPDASMAVDAREHAASATITRLPRR